MVKRDGYEPEFTAPSAPLFKMSDDEVASLKDEIVAMKEEQLHCEDAAKKLAAPYKSRAKELAFKIRERIETLRDDQNPRMLKNEMPRIRTRDSGEASVTVNGDEIAKAAAGDAFAEVAARVREKKK